MMKKAFTLLEVLMAIGIVIMAVSIVANLQLRSLNRLLFDRDQLEKVFYIKKVMSEYFLTPPKTQKKAILKLENPEISIATIIEDIDKKSSLAVLKDKVRVVRSHGEWKASHDKREMIMVTVIPKISSDKKEAMAA